MTYPEWLEWQRTQKAAMKRERFEKFVEFLGSLVEGFKGSANFYSRKARQNSYRNCWNSCNVFARIGEIMGGIAFFISLICGLNLLALIV